jgi:diguanylate cyclase (GGDEF)-like protein
MVAAGKKGRLMSSMHRRSGRWADRTRRASSIRSSIVWLAIIAVAPLLVDRVRLMEVNRADAIAAAGEQALDLARTGVDKQEEVLIAARSVVQAVSHAIERILPTDRECNRFLSDTASEVPWMKVASIVTPAGRVTCSSNPQAMGLDIADRAYFRKALVTKDFVVSGFVFPRAHSQPVIIVTYAKRDPHGEVKAVINTLVDLRWIGQLANVIEHRPGAVVLLVDADGTVLAGHPNRDAWVGRELHTHPFMREVRDRSTGTAAAAGFDSVRRIWGFRPVADTGAHLLVGLDEREVLSQVQRDMTFAYLQLALTAALILIGVWFFGEHAILRPVRRLAHFAERLGRGDLALRASPRPWAAEFVPLTRALDSMASRLAAREHNLRVESEHFKELATLDSLTGLPNRRRFDAHLASEWALAASRTAPLSLLMIDVDHFKPYNDRYGHLQGDSCLRAIGGILQGMAERGGFAARFGGEEFSFLLSNTDTNSARRLAESIRRAVESLGITHADAPSGRVTISIGLAAVVPAAGGRPNLLVETADAALYASKRHRNCVTTYAHTLLAEAS